MASASSSAKPAASSSISGVAAILQSLAGPCFNALTVIIPFLIANISWLYRHFQKLPQNAILFIYGFVFCFFGGTFPTLFAAIQAAKHGGRQTVIQAVAELSDEALIIIEESKKDDDADDDKDGKSDASQLSSRDLMIRKTKLVLRKMNPERVDTALAALYKVWLSVAAVLSIQFARTISLALTIAEFLQKPMDRFVAPVLRVAVPDEYERWIPVLLSWMVKSIAMSFAWYIQSIISAFASALAGGLMMARALYQLLVAHNIKLFGWIPEDHTQTYIDEIMQYSFAALGFYTQFKLNFGLPFPLNFILLPFELAEYYIRWTITRRT